MKISEINKLLVDPKMQNKNTNLKIIDNNGVKVTNRKLLEAINNLGKRIDNLVAKNNLKE